MKASEAHRKLKSKGTAQNRKIYARHGVQGEMYGVSYANLGALRKEIRTDHALALELWDSGNHDARLLATMIADPEAMTAKTLDAWAGDLDCYPIADAFSGLAARTSFAQKRMDKWTRSSKEWIGAAGWNLVAYAAGNPELPDATFRPYLERIESGIHKARNRARYSMNTALISIGIRSASLEKAAIAAARRIGPVEVDHGETGCKTPDAVTYIPKARAHRAAKEAKAKARTTGKRAKSTA